MTNLDYTFERQLILEREDARAEGWEEGKEEGRKEGREEGRKEGQKETQLKMLMSYMEKTGNSFDESCQLFDIEDERKASYQKSLGVH